MIVEAPTLKLSISRRRRSFGPFAGIIASAVDSPGDCDAWPFHAAGKVIGWAYSFCRRRHRVVSDILEVSLTVGLPSLRPLACTCRNPARTRSTINARSNSAIAPMIWNIRRPDDFMHMQIIQVPYDSGASLQPCGAMP
jgi:hypothetical protein